MSEDGFITVEDESGEQGVTMSHRVSVGDIDVDLLHNTLASVNPFAAGKKGLDKHNQKVLMFEISARKVENKYVEMNLRELLQYLEHCSASAAIDISSSLTYSFVPNFEDIPESPSKSLLHRANSNVDEGNYYVVHGLRLRDLRRLDFKFNPVDEPSVLVRRHIVLLLLDDIRALVMADRLILIVPDGADSLLQTLEQHMEDWKVSSPATDSVVESHFETHAYEALFTTVNAIFQQEYLLLSSDVKDTLEFSRQGCILPIEKQEKMRVLKNTVSESLNRLASFRRVLMELMEDDETMALMNLTILKAHPFLYKAPLSNDILITHEIMEELLESFLMDFNSMEAKFSNLRSQLINTEESISLRLDTSRNELLIANTSLTVLTVAIAFGGYLTGIFGMNLDNVSFLQPMYGSFALVFSCSFCVILLIFSSFMYYYTSTGVLPLKSKELRK